MRDDLSTNHGGVAAVDAPGVRLTRVDVGVQCASCELLCVRVTSASSSCVAVVIYRTGAVTSTFFAELSDILDRVSTLIEPICIVGETSTSISTVPMIQIP